MKGSIHSIHKDASQRPAYNIPRQSILNLISFPPLGRKSPTRCLSSSFQLLSFPSRHLCDNPAPSAAAPPPLPSSLSSHDGPVMRACTGELGVNSDLRGHWDYLQNTFLADAFLGHCAPIPSSDHTRRQLVDEFASFPSKTSKAFHRKGDKPITALVGGHMSKAGVVVALSRLRSWSSWSIWPALPARRWTPAWGSA